jgi:hypothetical protein
MGEGNQPVKIRQLSSLYHDGPFASAGGILLDEGASVGRSSTVTNLAQWK